MSVTLYDLTDQYRQLVDAVDQEDSAEAFTVALSTIKDEFNAKVIALAKVIQQFNAEADVYATEAKRLQERAQARTNRVAWLKDYLKQNMADAGIKSVRGDLVDVRLQDSPPSVDVYNEERLGPEWKRARLALPLALVPEELIGMASVEVDKRGILDWIKAGNEAPDGAVVTRSQHIRIR